MIDLKPRGFNRPVAWALLLLLNIVLGTAWHEVVGHGLTGIACGGRITQVSLIGFQVWPNLRAVGAQGVFGTCDVEGIRAGHCEQTWLLAGSLSTFAVSVCATLLLSIRRWTYPVGFILAGLSLWWIDLLTYTLPSFGLRRYVLFGRRHAEPYDAAVALGFPGWAFQFLTVAGCVVLLVAFVRIAPRAFSGPRRAGSDA